MPSSLQGLYLMTPLNRTPWLTFTLLFCFIFIAFVTIGNDLVYVLLTHSWFVLPLLAWKLHKGPEQAGPEIFLLFIAIIN